LVACTDGISGFPSSGAGKRMNTLSCPGLTCITGFVVTDFSGVCSCGNFKLPPVNSLIIPSILASILLPVPLLNSDVSMDSGEIDGGIDSGNLGDPMPGTLIHGTDGTVGAKGTAGTAGAVGTEGAAGGYASPVGKSAGNTGAAGGSGFCVTDTVTSLVTATPGKLEAGPDD